MAILVDNFSGSPLEGKGLTIELDYTGGPGDQPVYVGWAEPGTLTSAAKWKIEKLTYSGDNLVRRQWAKAQLDGQPAATATTKFVHVWDDRAGLSYG